MSAECPPPDRVFLAARGELPPAEAAPLQAHAAGCADCGPAWHMAAVARPISEEEAARPADASALPSGFATGAVAALVVVAGLLAWLLRPA